MCARSLTFFSRFPPIPCTVCVWIRSYRMLRSVVFFFLKCNKVIFCIHGKISDPIFILEHGFSRFLCCNLFFWCFLKIFHIDKLRFIVEFVYFSIGKAKIQNILCFEGHPNHRILLRYSMQYHEQVKRKKYDVTRKSYRYSIMLLWNVKQKEKKETESTVTLKMRKMATCWHSSASVSYCVRENVSSSTSALCCVLSIER